MAKAPRLFAKEVNSELASLKRWKTLGEQILQDCRRELLNVNVQCPIGINALNLTRAAVCLGRLSLLEINAGDVESGWANCHLSSAYLANGAIMSWFNFPKMRAISEAKWTFDLEGHSMACALMHCLLLDCQEEASILARLLSSALLNGWFSEQWLVVNPVIRFSLGLYAIDTGLNRVPDQETNFECYREVFSCWSDSHLLSQVLTEMSEFHVQHMTDQASKTKQHWTIEFKGAYVLFPVELIATLAVRERRQFPSVNVRHPFFETIWTKPELSRPQPDDVLIRFLPKVRELISRNDPSTEKNSLMDASCYELTAESNS